MLERPVDAAGRVTGTEPLASDRPGNRSVISAEVPAVELLRYPVVLRSLSARHGVVHPSAAALRARAAAGEGEGARGHVTLAGT